MTKSRTIAAYTFVILSFLSLLLRYGYLQLIDHGSLLQQSINNYSSIVASLPVRGGIVDKDGVILADNKVSYVVAALPKDLKDSKQMINKLAKYVNITALDKKKYYAQLKKSKNYDWIIIKDDLSNTEIANLTAHRFEFPEVSVFAHTKRYYPFEEIYSHSLGYVGRVSMNDKQKLYKSGQAQDYLANDYIGKSGLEQYYEPTLRGQIGKKVIQTDAFGNEVGLIANSQATDGYTLQLTLDNDLQKLAWQLLGNHKGAIVAIDPQSGGILTFVSKPGFDPNWFIDGISIEDWGDLTNNPQNPLLNRATQGTYPPGSTFKPFLALASLYLGVRTPHSTINDPGYFVIPGSSHRFRDSYPYGRGLINFTQAITYSSDTFFYKLGLDMGIDRMNKGLTLFGFGRKIGVDLPHENPGLLPSRQWKARHFANDPYQKNWLAADSVTMGVGQGFNNYSPLQMAYATSIIAAGGVAHTPHFLDKVIDKDGKVMASYVLESQKLPIPQSQIQFIKHAMAEVVAKGTAAIITPGLKYS
ncbi:MAG: penicillin-binding protein 2, partial [Burkholderiales bacterium]